MEKLISVIVPVYGAEQYLEDCLESLIGQSFEQFEAILIDDGSPDGSGEICDRYASADHRISVIHQTNAGVSAARNVGLELASGDYVFFLDADDVLPGDSLKVLYSRMEPESMVAGSVCALLADGSKDEYVLRLPEKEMLAENFIKLLFHEKILGYQGYLCNKLFDNRVIQREKLRFVPEIRYNEDRLFITEYLLCCHSVKMVPDVIYLYRQHENSALAQTHRSFRESMLTELDAFERIRDLLTVRDPELAEEVARLTFEKALFWLRRIPKEYPASIRKTRKIVFRNADVCVHSEALGLAQKIKIIGHCILRK